MTAKRKEILDVPQEKRSNPYKGLQPYKESDENVFHGREDDAKKLFKLIRLYPLTVLLGKSGIGKTSLLNAGVFPKMRSEGYLPIPVRLNYTKGTPPLLDQIHQAIKDSKLNVEILESEKSVKPFAESENKSLLKYFQKAKLLDPLKNQIVKPVLVIDQFEEFFTLGKEHRDRRKLIDELHWLVEDQFVKSAKEGIKNNSQTSKAPQDYRVIICLREDYLPDLIDLKERLTTIDQILYRIMPLNGQKSREIIGMPGGFADQKTIDIILRAFYPDETVDDEEIADEKLEVEPVLLSLVCHEVFEEKETVESFTKKDRDRILSKFYDTVIKKCPQKLEIEKFIENNLLTKGGRYRTHYPLEPDASLKKSINYLIEKRILRKDYVGNKEHIEIIHDVLAPIVAEKRDMRLAKEERRESWKKFTRKFISITAVLLFLISVYAIFQTFRAYNQSRISQVNWLTAEALLEFPEDNTRAVRIAAESFKKGLPNPPARTCRVLSEIAYSSYEKPFYSAILRHDDSIYSAVFSPDGQKILTVSEDKTAKLWDMEGNLLDDKIKHEGRVPSAVFSPDGKYILTASWDKTAKLWSLEGKLLAEFKHTSPVTSAVFSSKGNLILTASRDNTSKLWNLQGKLIAELKHDGAVSSATFSPDNKRILTSSWDKSVRLWDLKGNLRHEFLHDGAVESAVFSPNGQFILSASWDKTAKLWDLDGKLLAELQHDEAVESAVFSSDGKQILTASRDKRVKLWDLQGKTLLKLEFEEVVSFAKFSSDNRHIITVSRDHIARIWNRKEELLSELRHNGKINSAVFSNDNKWILTASGDGTAKLWSLKNEIITELSKHTAAVKTAVFSPDGSKMLTASNDNTAILWGGGGKSIPLRHGNVLSSAVFSPDGGKILTASMDQTAKLWNQDGKQLKNLPHGGAVSSAVFSQDGNWILTVSLDGAAMLWDQEGNLLKRMNSAETVSSAMFSPESNHIITTPNDNTPKIWDLEGNLILELKEAISASSAMFSPDGQKILTTTKDGSARLWGRDGKKLLDLEFKRSITFSVFSPDSRMILTASEDDAARLWNIDGSILAEFKHDGTVKSAVFSQDNKMILTSSKDSSAKLWNLKGEMLAILNKHKGVVNSAVFSSDGQRILTSSDDGTAVVWLTPNAIYEWLKTAKIPHLSDEDKRKLGIR